MEATAYPRVMTIRLTPAQAEAIRRLAALDDRRPSSFARRLVAEGIEKRTAPAAAAS